LLLPQIALSDDSCDAKLQTALAELNAAKQEIASLKAKEVSVLAMVSEAGRQTSSALQQLLDQTDVDEQVMGRANDVVGRVTSLSYTDIVNTVTSHDLYKTHAAPHVAKVVELAQPHVDPALKTAQTYFDQAKEACRPHYETAANLAGDLPKHATTMGEAVDKILAPVFVGFEKATGKVGLHITLPASRVDKISVILLVAFLAWCVFTLTLGLVLKTVKIACKLLGVPLFITKKTVSLMFWFGTGFYCCGLCRSKAKKAPNGNAKTPNGNAKKQPEKGAAAKKAAAKKQPEKGKK